MRKARRITVHTEDPQEFASCLFQAVRDKNLPAWEVDDRRGTRFTHRSAEQLAGKAWLVQSYPEDGFVRFKLRPPDGETDCDNTITSAYVGRFVEMLVNRFGTAITRIEVDQG